LYLCQGHSKISNILKCIEIKFKDIDTNLRLDDSGLYNVAFAAAIGAGNWDVAYEVPRPVHEKYRSAGKPAPPVTRLRWKVLSYGYFDRQRSTYQILQNVSAAPPVVSGNAINYPQIFNGIDIRYLCQNTSVKEEIVLSQIARSGLPDPAKFNLSRANTYFVVTMEFLLTPNNINAFARRPAGKTPIKQGNNFNFDGDDPIEFEDEDATRHFFFPKDYAHAVADSVTDFANRISLRRYFYSDRGKNYMLVGVPLNWINSAPAGELIIDPTTTVIGLDDVYLQDATQYGSNTSLVIGKSTGTYKKRTIIKFNVSGVPSNATVINAQMKLRYYGVTGSPWIDRSVQAHQLLVNWGETQATKDNRLTGTGWALAYGAINGTDANATMESKTLFKVNEFPVWKNWDLTTLTQKWINGLATNYGVILWATNEDTDGMNLWFRSSEYSDSNYTPRLEVTWSNALHAVYFLKDHLGSIRATVYDSAAAVIGYDDYDPWGYPLATRTKVIPTPYLQGRSKNKFTEKETTEQKQNEKKERKSAGFAKLSASPKIFTPILMTVCIF